MSLINKVLKDLDNRQEHNSAAEGQGSAVEPTRASAFSKTPLWGLLAIILVAAIGFAAYHWLTKTQPEPAASKPESGAVAESQPEPEPVSRQATTEPFQLPEPISEPQQPASGESEPKSEPKPGQQVTADFESKSEPEPEPEPETEPKAEQKQSSFNKQSVQLTAAEVAERSLQKAREAQQQGLFTDAADYFSQTLQAQPQLHEARKEWAALEYGRGQLSRALSIVREGLSRDPDAHSLRLLAASMLQKSGEQAMARQLLTQRQPDPSQLPQYYQFQAELAQQLNDKRLMQQSYRALLQSEPDNGRWHLGLALALKHEDAEQALRLFEQAASLIEHQPTLQYIARQIQQIRRQHEASSP
ncbi:tetratricopeptide repeat protein [Idiomarina seosinensis]|uniref:hypothetical protein n=1 Tax=Idiomarina seosinensis TaxID=281739 RepID=UPI00384E304F